MTRLLNLLDKTDSITTRVVASTTIMLLTAAIFALDLLGPQKLVLARFYTVPVILAGLVLSARWTFFTGVASFILTLVVDIYRGRLDFDYFLLIGLIAAVTFLSTTLSVTLDKLRKDKEDAEDAFRASKSEAETLALLNDAARAISSSLDQDDILMRLLKLSKEFLQADGVHVKLREHARTLHLAAEAHNAIERAAELHLEDSRPGLLAAETNRIIAYRDIQGQNGLPEDLVSAVKDSGIRGAAFIPMAARNKSIGILAVYWHEPHVFDSRERDVVDILTAQAVIAIENARLYEESERAGERLRRLFRVGRNVASHLDIDEVAEEVTGAVRELLAPAESSLLLPGPDNTPTHRGRLELRRYHQIPEHRDVCDHVVQNAATIQTDGGINTEPAVVKAFNVACSPHCKFPKLVRDAGFHSVIAVPVIQNQEVLGVLSALRLHDDKMDAPYSEEDISLLRTLASLAGVAIANASAFERHRSMAQTLQENLLPRQVPRIPGIDIGTFYASATSEAYVGGDFYDFVPLADGRTVITIGDVCGKGIEAASDTAMVKYMLRMLAIEDADPASILTRVNRALFENLRAGRFITLFYSVYDLNSGELTYASAGHHSPVCSRKEGYSQLPVEQGTALGVIPDSQYKLLKYKMDPGEIITLYTDGLVEARHEGELLGVERVGAHTVSLAELSAREIAADLPRLALDFTGGKLVDDLAVLVIRRLPGR